MQRFQSSRPARGWKARAAHIVDNVASRIWLGLWFSEASTGQAALSALSGSNKGETMVSELTARSAADVVSQFKALGDPTRLRIFEFLCACCCPVAVEDTGEVRRAEGPTAGEVCCSVTGVEKITSTVSFHLKELRQAGLITMERQGKTMVCGINQEALAALRSYVNGLGEERKNDCAC